VNAQPDIATAPTGGDAMPPALQESAQHGRLAWRRLGLRLRSITPAGLARALLVVGVLSLTIWLIARAGAAMLPFWVGLIFAYATLPFVNWLDRFVPRMLAVLILVGIELLLLAVIVGVLVPVLAREIVQLVQSLPDANRLPQSVNNLVAGLTALPVPVQEFLRTWLQNEYANIQVNFTDFLLRFVGAGAVRALSAARWVTFMLSFLVIPNWMVAVLHDQRQGHNRVDRMLPAGWRPDFWALVRIVDRTFNAFVRGRLIIAVLVGLLTYVGLRALPLLGLPEAPFPIGLPLIVGVFNLVPIVGPIVGAVPLAIVGLSVSWTLALSAIVLYIAVLLLMGFFVAPRLENRAVDIHPALLAPIIVLGSTFGFWGAVLAGPLAVVARDLVRYLYGRLGEPARPAGLLPGAVPVGESTATTQRVPLRQPRPLAAERQ
jgi:predicted PurR-regulated permease PerM